MLEVRVFEIELAIVLDQFGADVLRVAGDAVIAGQNRRLPGGRAAVAALCRIIQQLTGLVVQPR